MNRAAQIRLAVSITALALVAAACGENPLADVGRRSSDWIGGGEGQPPVVPSGSTVPAPALRNGSGQVVWANDDLGFPSIPDPRQVVAEVWDRSSQIDRFVQASRFEISVALPGVKFPGVLPATVQHVTSQLVYNPAVGELSESLLAAFGLWAVEPYSKSKLAGQAAVLSVMVPAPADATSTQDATGCGRFSERDLAACEQVTLEAGTGWLLEDASGKTLVWLDGDYRYELFHRPEVDTELVKEMAETMVPLAEVGEAVAAAHRIGPG